MSDEQFAEIWVADRLDRAKDAAFLKAFLSGRVKERGEAGRPASYVLNIDAKWGEGKSFFLDRFGKTLEADQFLVARVNAWQDDYADDPLLSVMDAIDQAVAPLVKREEATRDRWNVAKRAGAAIAVAAAKGAAVQFAKRTIGSGLDEIGDIINAPSGASEKATDEITKALGDLIGEQGKALIERFREGKKTIAQFRACLGEFLKIASSKGQKLPLFVLVDELDRCRPPFAIALLERIKHLFEIDEVVFVVASNTEQLSHSIGAVYGNGFDSLGYLSRFFDRSYFFERVSRQAFVEGLYEDLPLDTSKISVPPLVTISDYLTGGFDYFGLSLRDIEQVYDILRSVTTIWDSKLKIEMAALLPIAVAYQQRVDIPVDSDVGATLRELSRRKNSGKKLSWQVPVVQRGFERGSETVEGAALAADFFGHAMRSLADLNYDVTAAHSQWVVGRLSEEFSIVHGNTFRRDSPPYSVIRSYPEMVRTAGRLLPHGSRV